MPDVQYPFSMPEEPSLLTIPRGFIYVAAPCASPDPDLQSSRRAICDIFTVNLANQGIAAFSPLSYNVPLKGPQLRPDFNWYAFDLNFLAASEGMVVLQLDGWEQSYGVKLELNYCTAHSKPVLFHDPSKRPFRPDFIQKFGRNILI